MNIFAIAAGMMAVIHLVAGWQRPRLAVIVSGIYGCSTPSTSVWWRMASCAMTATFASILCSSFHIGTRNLLRLPVVHGATRPDDGRRQVLGVMGLFSRCWWRALATLAPLGVAIAGALAIGVYAIKSKFMTNRS